MEHVGCEDLAKRIGEINPAIHAFGHIHEDYGQLITQKTHFINASSCTVRYNPDNSPIVVELGIWDNKGGNSIMTRDSALLKFQDVEGRGLLQGDTIFEDLWQKI
jgi:hypothetical protein